jgi:hypothetical protein
MPHAGSTLGRRCFSTGPTAQVTLGRLAVYRTVCQIKFSNLVRCLTKFRQPSCIDIEVMHGASLAKLVQRTQATLEMYRPELTYLKR